MKTPSMPMTTRREFLTAAAGLAGYSLFVKAPQSLAACEDRFVLRESVAPRIDELAPDNTELGAVAAEPNLRRVDLRADLLVVGGGLAGVCAAISAARHGARVILVQDRSRLGGNASSEIKMHPLGSQMGFRECGLIEEFCLENAYQNEQDAWEVWDLILYDKVIREPNIRLLLDSTLYRVEMDGERIRAAWVRCDRTEHLYRIEATLFVDSTGDGRLGLEAGAEFMIGREAPEVFGESHGNFDPPGTTQGSSILFTSRKHDRPMPFEAPSWARQISESDLYGRPIKPGSWVYGYWWIELGGVYDTIRDNERLRFELLAIVLGVWDYIKNSGKFPEAANYALDTVGMIPGKRESRRFVGDYIMTQHDLEGRWKQLADPVAFGGWMMDDHPALGFDAKDRKPYTPHRVPEPYNIAYGSLYSRNVPNLMLAGRDVSASHVAFTSMRVMKTCAVIGQAVGTAAAQCIRDGLLPRQLRADRARLAALQQSLLRDGAIILGVKNEDPADLARKAKVTASGTAFETTPERVINGVNYDRKGENANRWMAPMGREGAWLQLEWEAPVTVREVRLVHDTGLHRQLTMTLNPDVKKRCAPGPQPETTRDYRLVGIRPDGSEVELASVAYNYQRLRCHRFDPVSLRALRVVIERTNGAEHASLYEVRAYA